MGDKSWLDRNVADGNWADAAYQLGIHMSGEAPAYMAAQARQQEVDNELSDQRRLAWIKDNRSLLYHLNNKNYGAATEQLANRRGELVKLGADTTETDGMFEMMAKGQYTELQDGVQSLDDQAVLNGDLPSWRSAVGGDKGSQFGRDRLWQDEENNYYQSTMVNDPNTGKSRTSRVPMFGAPDEPVGKVVPVSDLGQTPGQIVKHKAAVAAATETSGTTARLETEFKLKPKVEVAVREAVSNFERSFDREGEAYENSAVLQTYDAAMGGLMKSLGATTTGPVVGWLLQIQTKSC